MQTLKTNKLSVLFLLLLFTCSFTNPDGKKIGEKKPAKTIVEKIEKNLLSGWTITNIDDDQSRFSDQMKTLGITYGLTLINEDLPIVLNTTKGKFTEYSRMKILVNSLDKQQAMTQFVQQKAKSGAFQYCFIETRQYFLTIIWTECRIEYLDNNNKRQLVDFGKDSKHQKYRKRLLKQLSWYFDTY